MDEFVYLKNRFIAFNLEFQKESEKKVMSTQKKRSYPRQSIRIYYTTHSYVIIFMRLSLTDEHDDERRCKFLYAFHVAKYQHTTIAIFYISELENILKAGISAHASLNT